MANKPTAVEKLNRKKDPKKVVLEAAYGGMQAGQKMFVATPLIADEYIRRIPHGETQTIPEMRENLATANGCDGTCPMSSSIFVRMVTEAALEEIDAGKPLNEVAPFWRVIESGDKLTKKLTVDPAWVDEQRAIEASG